MKAKSYLLLLVLTMATFFCVASLEAQDIQPSEIFRAAEVARQDFSTRLNKDRDPAWRYGTYVADIHNYNIGLSESDKFYVVVFFLKKGSANLKGGGGEYKIGKDDLRIINFVGYK